MTIKTKSELLKRHICHYLLSKMTLTLLFVLFLIIHIDLQQSDEHPKQDTEKLQVGSGFTHLAKDTKNKYELPVYTPLEFVC